MQSCYRRVKMATAAAESSFLFLINSQGGHRASAVEECSHWCRLATLLGGALEPPCVAFVLSVRVILCFHRPLNSPLCTWRENSDLVKLLISLTTTPLYHLRDYRLDRACLRGPQRQGKSGVTQTIISSSCWVNGYLLWRSRAVQLACRLRRVYMASA